MEQEPKKTDKKLEAKPEEEPEDKSKAQGLLDEAKATADRIEAANEKQEELLQRQEELKSTEILSGTSEAGQAPAPEKTEDEKWAEGAKERYAGTGMDPTPAKDSEEF